MTNHLRGEFTFAGRDGTAYTGRICTNEIIKITAALNVKGSALTDRLREMLLEDARAILHISLGRHHEGLSLERVGELMDDIGDAANEPVLVATWKLLASAFNRSTQGSETTLGEETQAPNP